MSCDDETMREHVAHLGFTLLPVDDLGRDDLGGRGLGSGAHAFGLRDDHLGNGSGRGDDGRFGPLNRLEALLTLQHTHTQSKVFNKDANKKKPQSEQNLEP